jgi:hypothetical protein
LLNPDLWKTALVQDWMAIFVAWITLFGAFVIASWISVRLRRGSRRPGKATLQFVTYQRGTFWTKQSSGLEEITHLRGVWRVTNTTDSDVRLKDFRLRRLATEHRSFAVGGSGDPGYVLPPNAMREVEINCVIQQTAIRRDKPLRADVCFEDHSGNEYWVRRVTFTYRTPANPGVTQ